MTILFDIIKIATYPSFDSMSFVESFGAAIYVLIFLVKFGIVQAIYLYQKKEDSYPSAFAFIQTDTYDRDEEIME